MSSPATIRFKCILRLSELDSIFLLKRNIEKEKKKRVETNLIVSMLLLQQKRMIAIVSIINHGQFQRELFPTHSDGRNPRIEEEELVPPVRYRLLGVLN